MPSSEPARRTANRPSKEHVDALMAASRVLLALSVRSLAEVDEVVTLAQLRVLVVLSSQGPANLSSLAEVVGVHASNASRTCDQLVGMGLVDRQAAAVDRRNIVLAVSERGRGVVAAVLNRRRALLTELLAGVSTADREALTPLLHRLVASAGDIPTTDIWSAG